MQEYNAVITSGMKKLQETRGRYEERLAGIRESHPDMPVVQAQSVATFCDLGWEWDGLGINNSVDIKRTVMNDVTESAYIREDGSFRYA